jgi:hypothetical protein
MSKCPRCGSQSVKVIYFGLPFRLCVNEECSCLFGRFDGILERLPEDFPIDGRFMMYEGSYVKALYRWLRGGWNG